MNFSHHDMPLKSQTVSMVNRMCFMQFSKTCLASFDSYVKLLLLVHDHGKPWVKLEMCRIDQMARYYFPLNYCNATWSCSQIS